MKKQQQKKVPDPKGSEAQNTENERKSRKRKPNPATAGETQ